MTLSIIIPVYNVEACLAECLDSVFSQDLTDCEVIAVNDGATDGSRAILAQYQTIHPEFIIIDQPNKGLSGARNSGMARAKGEYLYFLDSDDYLLPNAVSTIIKSIQSTKAEVIGFNATANGDTVYIPSFKVSDKAKTGIDYFVDFYAENGIYPTVNVWLYTYKKSFLVNNNHTFKEGLFHEDVLFTMRTFYYAKSIAAQNTSIVNYRQNRDGSICTNIKLKNLTDRTIVCRDLDAFFKLENFTNKHFYNVLFQQYHYNIDLAVSNNFLVEKKDFFSAADKAIMKKGITNNYEFKVWVLACVNIKLLDRYMKNSLSGFQRKLINIIGTVLYK